MHFDHTSVTLRFQEVIATFANQDLLVTGCQWLDLFIRKDDSFAKSDCNFLSISMSNIVASTVVVSSSYDVLTIKQCIMFTYSTMMSGKLATHAPGPGGIRLVDFIDVVVQYLLVPDVL